MKMTRLFAAGLALTLAACGSSPPPKPPAAKISLSDLCPALAAAACDRLARCNLLSAPLDAARCSTRERAGCDAIAAEVTTASAAGQIVYDATQGPACKDAVSSEDCSLGLDRGVLVNAACKAAFSGKGVAGAACQSPTYCASGFSCDAASASCPGHCQADLTNNTACGGAGQHCAAGLYCSAKDMRCHAAVGAGAACELSSDGNACQTGLYCDMTDPASPKCAAVRGRHMGCNFPYECAAGLLCLGNACSSGAAGDTCVTETDCARGLACGADSLCHPPGKSGDDCSAVPCREELTCTSSAGKMACASRPGMGDACTPAGAPCYLSRCASGQCAAWVADGGNCSDPTECQPGHACQGGRCATPTLCGTGF
jgi:hypothetical protein